MEKEKPERANKKDGGKKVKLQILTLQLEERGSFSLLVTTNLKVLAPLQNRNTDKNH